MKGTIGAEASVWQKFDQKNIQGHSKQKATIGTGHNNYVCTKFKYFLCRLNLKMKMVKNYMKKLNTFCIKLNRVVLFLIMIANYC